MARDKTICIREAETPEDIDRIATLVEQEARKGHFRHELAISNNINGFKFQIFCAINWNYYPRSTSGPVQFQGMTPDNQIIADKPLDLCPARVEVITVNKTFVGFHFWYAEPPQKKQNLVEYYMLAIEPGHRKKGYARRLIDHALQTIPMTTTITARCYPESGIMYEYLQRRGFLKQGDEGEDARVVRKLYRPSQLSAHI